MTHYLLEPASLDITCDDHVPAVKFLATPRSDDSDVAETAAPCESEISSDETSQPSCEEMCPSCKGNGYHESRKGTFTCKLCKGRGSGDFSGEAIEGRPLRSAAVGVLVARGPDWQYGDLDGGAGAIGEVLQDRGGGWAQVRWSNGFSDDYRVGFDNLYDLIVHKGLVDEQEDDDTAITDVQETPGELWLKSRVPWRAAAAMAPAPCMFASAGYWTGVSESPCYWDVQYGAMTQMPYPSTPVMHFGSGGGARTPLRKNAPLFVPQM